MNKLISDKKGFFIPINKFTIAIFIFIFVIYLAYTYLPGEEAEYKNSTVHNIGRELGFTAPDSKLIEQEIFKIVNRERANNNKFSLDLDYELASLARDHSKDMKLRDFYEHTNPDGDDPTDRAEKKGINTVNGNYIGIAENIAIIYVNNDADCQTHDENELGVCLMNKWMHSPGHRANILDGYYDSIGIGVYCDAEQCWATQDFR
jgi:uncharacterized protein YkwD